MTFSIRAYRPDDEAAWLQCRLTSFFATDYYDDVKTQKTTLEPDGLELVAETDGAIVGILDIEIDGQAATIDTVAVSPVAQRMGVASSLLGAALDLLPRAVTTLDAWTREMPAANHWYQRHGFVENYRYLHVYRSDGDPSLPAPAGMSEPVHAFLHAPIERELELRAQFSRVYVCRQYVRTLG